MAWSCAVPDVWRSPTRHARDSLALGISRIERANVCSSQWQTWSLVLQPRCRQQHCGLDSAGVVSFAVFSRANVLRGTEWMDRVQMRPFASWRALRRVEWTISSDRRSIFGGPRIARALSDGTLLPLYDGWRGASHLRRNSSRAVAAPNWGSRTNQQYYAGSRGNLLSAIKTVASFCKASGRGCMAAAAIGALIRSRRAYHLWKTKNTAIAIQPKPAA